MLSGGNIGKQVVRLGAAAELRVEEAMYSFTTACVSY
jgi:hypothetical protein